MFCGGYLVTDFFLNFRNIRKGEPEVKSPLCESFEMLGELPVWKLEFFLQHVLVGQIMHAQHLIDQHYLGMCAPDHLLRWMGTYACR